MTKALLNEGLKLNKSIRDSLNAGRLDLVGQIALLEYIQKVEDYLSKPTKRKVAKPAKFGDWFNLIKRFAAKKSSLECINAIKLENGWMVGTDLESATWLKVEGLPDGEYLIGQDELKKLAGVGMENLAWSASQDIIVKVFDEETRQDIPIDQKFTSKEEAWEYLDLHCPGDEQYKSLYGNVMLNKYNRTVSVNRDVEVTTNGREVTLRGLDVEEFPIGKNQPYPGFLKGLELEKKLEISLSLEELEAMASVGKAAAEDDCRPTFTNVLMRFHKGGYILAAADGYQLIVDERHKFECHHDVADEDFLLSATRLEDVLAVIRKLGQEKVTLSVWGTGKRLMYQFKSESFIHWANMDEGEFPNYTYIIPEREENATVLEVGQDLGKFVNQIIKEVPETKKTGLDIRVEESVKVEAQGSSWEAPLTLLNKGEPKEIVLNTKYIKIMADVVQPKEIWQVRKSEPVVFQNGLIMGCVMPMHREEW